MLAPDASPACSVTFANERLVDRIKLMAGDPQTVRYFPEAARENSAADSLPQDPAVKRKIMSVLASWHRQFKGDPTMQLVAGLYVSCGGGTRKAPDRTAATEAYEKQQAKYEREAAERTERKMKDRSDKELAKERIAKEKEDREKAKRKGNKVKRPPFNFEAVSGCSPVRVARDETDEFDARRRSRGSCRLSARRRRRLKSAFKPALPRLRRADVSVSSLINALQRVNRETESITENTRVVECLAKAKADRKIVVRYIQLVDNDVEGDYVGTLLSTNEQVLAALALYDRMCKPIELDSDDEHVEEARSAATQRGLYVPEPDGDTASIRSRLSAFDWQDTEVDKLQERQRARVEKANRARAAQSVHPDLQDLSFGPTAGRHVPFHPSLPSPLTSHAAPLSPRTTKPSPAAPSPNTRTTRTPTLPQARITPPTAVLLRPPRPQATRTPVPTHGVMRGTFSRTTRGKGRGRGCWRRVGRTIRLRTRLMIGRRRTLGRLGSWGRGWIGRSFEGFGFGHFGLTVGIRFV